MYQPATRDAADTEYRAEAWRPQVNRISCVVLETCAHAEQVDFKFLASAARVSSKPTVVTADSIILAVTEALCSRKRDSSLGQNLYISPPR